VYARACNTFSIPTKLLAEVLQHRNYDGTTALQ